MNSLSQIGYPQENKLASFQKEEPINERYFRVSSTQKSSKHLNPEIHIWDDHVKKIRELIKIPDALINNPTHFLEINHRNFQNVYDYFKHSGKHYLVTAPSIGYHSLTDFLYQAPTHIAERVKLEILESYASVLEYFEQHTRCAAGNLIIENIYLRKNANQNYHILFSPKSFFPRSTDSHSLTAPECLAESTSATPLSDIHVFGQLALLLQSPSLEEPNLTHSSHWDFHSEFTKSRNKLSQRWYNIIADCIAENPLERAQSISSIIARAFQKKQSYTPELLSHSTSESHDLLNAQLEKYQATISQQEAQLLSLNDERLSNQAEQANTQKIINNLQEKITFLNTERDELKSDNQAILNQGDSGLEERFQVIKNRSEVLQQELRDSVEHHGLLKTKFELIKSECDQLRDFKFQTESDRDSKERQLQELNADNRELQQELATLQQKEKPLSTPILITLLVSCLAGAGLGFFWHNKTDKADHQSSIENVVVDLSEIPTKVNQLSSLITSQELLHFFNSSGVLPEHQQKLCMSLSADSQDGSIAAGCNHFVANNFCNWISQHLLKQSQIESGYFYRLPTAAEIKAISDSTEANIAQWTQDRQTDDAGIEIGHKIIASAGVTSWLPSFMQKSFDGDLMGFRVILDISKP